jgi:AcrR family transcriptional regulator
VISERRGTTIRDTRSIARRLGVSAVTLFAQHGFDAVTVSDIAEHAGVTARTFFRYFPSKETVIVDIYDETNARLVELIEARGPEEPVLGAITEATVEWCARYGDLFTALARMGSASESLAAAVIGRTTVWEDHLAGALCSRFPDLAGEDAKVWACTTMAMLRLMQRNAFEEHISFAEAARDAFSRLGALTAGQSPPRSVSAARR